MQRLARAFPTLLLTGVLLTGLPVLASAQDQLGPQSPGQEFPGAAPTGPDRGGLENPSQTPAPDLTPDGPGAEPAPVDLSSPEAETPGRLPTQEPGPGIQLDPQTLTGPTSGVESSPLPTPGFILEANLVKNEVFPVDLETVLKLVENQNLRLSYDEMGKKVVKAQFYRSLADFLPDFNGQYDHRRFQGVVQLFGNETLTIYQTVIEPGFFVTHRVYPGGTRIFNALAARKRVNAAKSLVKETYQEQLARAAEDYYNLLGAQLQRDFALLSLNEAREQVTLSQARFQAGVGTRLDVMQAKTSEAQRLRDLINANATIAKAEQVLLNRLNLDPDISLVPWKLDAEKRRLVPEEVPSDTLLQTALANHPTLSRLAEEAKALKWQTRSVLSEAVPAVDLNYSNTYRGPYIDQLGLTRAGGISITTTIGNDLGFDIPLRWLESNRLTKQKLLERQVAIRDLETRVINAHLDSLASASAIEAAREERDAAQESFRLAQGRFRAGVGINLDVISAEAALSAARSRLVESVVSFNRAQIQLLEAMGEITPENLRTGLSQTDLIEPEIEEDDE